MPRMNSTRTLHPPSGTSPVPSNLFSWATSMPEWVQTMPHGPLALVFLEWGKWMRMDSDCSNSVSFTTCASLTPSSRPSLNTRSPGNTCTQSTGTHRIWFWSTCATIKNALHTHFYHSADCDIDHSLVCCKIRLHPKKFHHAKKPGNPHIDVSKMTQPDLIEQFAEAFEEEYDAS